MRFGEDLDFSIRIFQAGLRCRLFPEAWVWHKRRTDFRKFWRQVFNSGIARINLYKKYPDSLKIVHLLPAVFTAGVIALALLFIAGVIVYGLATNEETRSLGTYAMGIAAAPILLYSLLILTDSTLQNGSPRIGVLSICAAFVQLTGYGCGFFKAWWRRCVCGKDEFQAYEKTFYK